MGVLPIANGKRPETERARRIVVVKRSAESRAVAFSATAVGRRLPHHSATASEYCPSSSTVARQNYQQIRLSSGFNTSAEPARSRRPAAVATDRKGRIASSSCWAKSPSSIWRSSTFNCLTSMGPVICSVEPPSDLGPVLMSSNPRPHRRERDRSQPPAPDAAINRPFAIVIGLLRALYPPPANSISTIYIMNFFSSRGKA
jgi:hypothetical protein